MNRDEHCGQELFWMKEEGRPLSFTLRAKEFMPFRIAFWRVIMFAGVEGAAVTDAIDEEGRFG